jgi:phage gpG-like protein
VNDSLPPLPTPWLEGFTPPQKMIDFTATLEFRGFDAAVTATLAAAGREALQLATRQVTGRIRDRLLSEGRLYGPGWLPRQARRERLPHRPLLFSTGRLRASFLEPGHPEHVEIIDADTDPTRPAVLLGSAVPYAAFHQWGAGNTPARSILTAEVLRGA